MEFAYPAAFAGFAAIPLLFIFNLWKYRRLRVTVGSLIIWKRLSQHAEAPPSSKQRYFNLSLLMQILVIIFLTTAIAGPRIKHSATAGRILHLTVDRSASTEANSAGSRVFDRITLSASTLLKLLTQADLVYCHAFPGLSGLEMTGPLTPADAQDWLTSLKPTQLEGNPADATQQVATRAALRGSQVFLFTDQPAGGLPPSVRVSATPADPDNFAITAAKAARDSGKLQLFFRIANFSPSTRTIKWEVIGAKGRQYAASDEPGLKLQPDRDCAVSLLLPPEAATEDVLEIRLLEPDALACDNSAYIFRNPTAELRISYIGRQDEKLLRILSALPGSIVTLAEKPEPGCTLAVFNESSPSELPRCDSVVIAPPDGIPHLVAVHGRHRYHPQAPFTVKDSDLTANPNWAEKITIREALEAAVATPQVRASVILEGGGPLIVDFPLEGRRVIYIGFALTDTNWPNLVSFPLFWGLLAERIGAGRAEWTTCRTGGTIALPARGLSDIVSPAGEVLTQPHRGPRILFQPATVGLYRANYSGAESLFAISLLSATESRLSFKSIPFNPSELSPARAKTIAPTETYLYQYFAFAAAVAMLASWLLCRERSHYMTSMPPR